MRGYGRRTPDIRRGGDGFVRLWTPADITLPQVFNYGAQHTNVSGKASVWIEEVAAKSALQGTPGNRPTITSVLGTEILDFELSDANFMNTSPATVTGGIATLTIGIIGSLETVAGIEKFVETNTGGAGSWAVFQEGSKLAVYAGGAAGQDYVWGNTTLTAARHLFIVEIPFGALTTLKPSSWVDNVAQTQTDIVATATNTTMNTSALTFGKWIAAGSQYWDGEQSLCRGWSGSLTSTERNQFYAYAKRVYGVA